MEIESQELSGWGCYPRARVRVARPAHRDEISLHEPLIARGQGRSYGNAALLTDGLIILTERLNNIAEFDAAKGVLRAEAGLTLAEVLAWCVPQGWFPVVTPGTKFVSLGGCVAADVHGKNHHHAGTFGNYINELELTLADSRRVLCGPQENAELFWATVGGMGLTGFINTVSLQLRRIESSYVVAQHQPAQDLDALLACLEGAFGDAEYSVAWLDCLARGRKLGRGVLMRGHHATRAETPEKLRAKLFATHAPPRLDLPFAFPSWALNPLTVKAFNALYSYWQGRRNAPFVAHYDSFFYPLDVVAHWNRLYGRRGFVQYQCVLPPATAREGLRELLEELSHSRRASFLAVLKRFGAEGRGLLSFPHEGYTLALDLPVRDEGLFALLARLDEIVLRHGGRVYLAKNARVWAETFRAMYPRLAEWQQIKAQIDPENRFRSDLSAMLQLCQT